MTANRRRSGFTLIEVLIVVVIMAVLAATIIPQFSSSAKDAKESSLKFNLHTLRSQIELYKMHHLGIYPATLDLLTKSTNISGTAGTAGTNFPYGPYVQSALPLNPFGNVNTIKVDSTTVLGVIPTGAASPGAGWIYRAATGEVFADHVDYTSL